MSTEKLRMASTNIQFDGATGKINAYLSKPDGTDARPGIIVIHEIFGLVDHTKDVAKRFAAQGYVTLAPDLFSGDEKLRTTLTPANVNAVLQFMQTLPTGRMRDTPYALAELAKHGGDDKAIIEDTMKLLFGGLPKEKLTQDLVKAVEYLNGQSFVKAGKIGSVGFCFGGGMSINLACHAITASCVIFYGENPSPIERVSKINCPVLGIYGGEDMRINSQLPELVKAMAEFKKDFEMRIYPGAPHAFFNDTNIHTYRQEAAKEAWDRTLRFYGRTLN